MGFDQPGTPVSPHLGRQSPFGAGDKDNDVFNKMVFMLFTCSNIPFVVLGDSYVEFGMCPIDKPFPDEDVVR
jgi:hypothetical protein